MNKKLARYSLKWNPFTADIPVESCYKASQTEHYLWRIENLAKNGGFSLLTGEPGVGKSVTLRLLVKYLENVPDLKVGILTRPQCSIPDFYRELGSLFGVQLSPHNRWAGAQALRENWQAHIEAALFRVVLIIDEAQEMNSTVLNELRLLSSAELDASSLLTVVLSGDGRLSDKFRSRELLPLGSRIRVRLQLENKNPTELHSYLQHALTQAGNPSLMTKELQNTLCERSVGNLRVLMNLAGELLDSAIRNDIDQMDEKLFFDVFSSSAASQSVSSRKKKT